MIFESAGQRKWKKTGDLLKQILAKYPAVVDHLKPMRVMEIFSEQERFINRLTEIFLQEVVTIDELKELVGIIADCKTGKLGNIDLVTLSTKC